MKPWKHLIQEPAGYVSPRTLVEVWGQQRVLVEYHRGILGYGSEEILVGATFGAIRIRGAGLRLCCMSREQLFVSGEILCVELEGRK